MSEAANATSTDNNGDSGLNGKLHVTTFRALLHRVSDLAEPPEYAMGNGRLC